jgi:hypothetical protein
LYSLYARVALSGSCQFLYGLSRLGGRSAQRPGRVRSLKAALPASDRVVVLLGATHAAEGACISKSQVLCA